MKKALSFFGNTVYTAIVLVVLAFALLFVGTRVDILGYEVKVVQSGSMEPAIMTGGIVVVAPTNAYNVGDVITFGSDTRSSVPITHRVIEKTYEGRSATYLTKGDANEEADSAAVAHSAVIGEVVFTVPYVGYVIDFARTPLGFALLVGIPALLIILDEFANIMWEVHKYRYLKRKHQSGKHGKRGGETGYRIPSRERSSRDFPQAKPPRQHRPRAFTETPLQTQQAQKETPLPPRPKTPAQIRSEELRTQVRPYESHVLDLRNYRAS